MFDEAFARVRIEGARQVPAGSGLAAVAPVSAEAVQEACAEGQFISARIDFLRLAEQSQILLLQQLDRAAAVRLSAALPNPVLARLCERLPVELSQAIVQSLRYNKRRAVRVIRRYRRRQRLATVDN